MTPLDKYGKWYNTIHRGEYMSGAAAAAAAGDIIADLGNLGVNIANAVNAEKWNEKNYEMQKSILLIKSSYNNNSLLVKITQFKDVLLT